MPQDIRLPERRASRSASGGAQPASDRPWQMHLYPQSERVAALARVPIVLLSVGWWLLAMHGRPANVAGTPVPLLAVAALALVWSLVMAAIVHRRPGLFEASPVLSTASDLVLMTVWLFAIGRGANAPFLPLALVGAASAATRAPLLEGALFSVAFAAVASILGGSAAFPLAGYTVVLGAGLSLFSAAVQRDRLYSLRDPLTGVYSRRYGLHQLHVLVRDQQLPFCLGLLDLDGFKAINDAYGHPTGDQVLATLASVMQTHLRQDDDVVRMGGDEFMLILPATELGGARLVAERLLAVMADTRLVPAAASGHVTITASIGLVQAQEGMSAPRLIERADACLYEAKRRRNAVVAEAG